MNVGPTTSAVSELFDNGNPATAWHKASAILTQINPAFDLSYSRTLFDDVMRLFNGEYPGYCPIKTPYHDRSHTLDVFLCAVRLIHGLHISGTVLKDHEIDMLLTATLMHDVGYAQFCDGKEHGTGAQFTKDHIARGIEFMRRYLSGRKLPPGFADALVPIVYCSDPMLPLAEIDFPDARSRLLGQILGTADLVGQMADRNYLEKLTSLYAEFEEANLGNYRNMYDMICKTHSFYTTIKKKLDDDFGGLYANLAFHFRDTMNAQNNFYMDSIEKNISYLEKVAALGEANYLSMLRRGNIIPKLATRESH